MKRRPFMLLEALLAFALVVLCVLPLIAPHVGMLKAERKFIQKVDLDHTVNLLYASILEQLYKNSIDWNVLTQGQPVPIPGYEGHYQFKVENYKPLDETANYHLYLLNLTFTFEQKNEKPLEYLYKVFVVRDRR